MIKKISDEKLYELMYNCGKLDGPIDNPNFSDRQFVIRLKELLRK